MKSNINHAIKALEEKNFFKLVCGASLNDTQMVENLSFIFTLAGAHVIDLAPRADVIFAARRGIEKAISYSAKGGPASAGNHKPLIMASIQLDQDPHFRKVKVNYDLCDGCGVCVKVCPTEAFVIDTFTSYLLYNAERCYGCNLCPPVCHVNALDMIDVKPAPEETLEEMIKLEVDAIEFHFGKSYKVIENLFENKIKNLVKGISLISFSIGSELLTDIEIAEAANLCYKVAGKGIILQCDGKPMSGGIEPFKNNGHNIDNACISVAKIIQKQNLPVYLQLSGGTTELTYSNALKANVNINGVAIGSYARKILKSYLTSLDIFTNKEALCRALETAKMLVNSVKGA